MAKKKRPKRRPQRPARPAHGGMPGGGNMNALMQQAQRVQAKISAAQEEVADYTGSSSVGGGMVSCTVDSDHQIIDLKIDESVVDPDDIEMLSDLIIAAVNEAGRELDEKVEAAMSEASGGMDLSGFGL